MSPGSDRGSAGQVTAGQVSAGSVQPGSGPTGAEITFEQIRERAYDLWERHHRPEDFSIALWLMAERELRAERDGRPQSRNARDGNLVRDTGDPRETGGHQAPPPDQGAEAPA